MWIGPGNILYDLSDEVKRRSGNLKWMRYIVYFDNVVLYAAVVRAAYFLCNQVRRSAEYGQLCDQCMDSQKQKWQYISGVAVTYSRSISS